MGSTPNGRGLLANGGDKMELMAIIGMPTKFPQEATSNENLWSFLLRARSAYTPLPKDRTNADEHYHSDPENGGTVSSLKFYKS
jgi:acyl transferase domain-containing protein